MGKLIKGMFLGGVTGVSVVAIRSYQKDEPLDELMAKATRASLMGSAIGGTLGLIASRRSRNKNKLIAAYIAGVEGAKLSKRALKQAKREAKRMSRNKMKRGQQPTFAQALEIAAEVRDVAMPILENWAEQAKPVAKDAAKSATKLAGEAREKASDTADAMKPHAKKAARRATKQAYIQAHKAREAAKNAGPTLDHAKSWVVDIRDEAVAHSGNGKSKKWVRV